jgi:hypothetical protein
MNLSTSGCKLVVVSRDGQPVTVIVDIIEKTTVDYACLLFLYLLIKVKANQH